MHEEFEVGQHLDQALRTAVTGIAQLMERIARRSAERSRQDAAAQRDQIRQQQQEFRDAQMLQRDAARRAENDARERARQTERETRERQAADRRAVLEQRDAARSAYGPWLREGAVERGDRVQAAQAWARAAGWAEQDPRASEAERMLRERISATHGVSPAQILRSVEPGQRNPTGVPAGRPTVREAVDLARRYAPHYYQLHESKQLGRIGATPVNGVQEQLVHEWQQWAATGTLPHDVLVREWARHSGKGEALDASRYENAEAHRAALEEIWSTGADVRDAAEFELHRQRMSESGMSTAAVDEAAGMGDRPRPDYEPYLDAEVFMTSDPSVAVAAWEAAAHASVTRPGDPVIAAAKANLENKFRTRWNTDPATYLADRLHDLQAEAADRVRSTEQETDASEDLKDAQQSGREAAEGAAVEQGGYVMLRAGAQNTDRGMSMRKAGSEEEKAHRAATWGLVESAWRAEQFEQRGREAAEAADLGAEWLKVPEQQRYAMFRKEYDSEAARMVWSADPAKVVAEGRGELVYDGATAVAGSRYEELQHASSEHPVAAVYRGRDADLPVYVTGPVVTDDAGRDLVPTSSGAHVPVDDLVEPTREALGYEPSWATDDGGVDRAAFIAAGAQMPRPVMTPSDERWRLPQVQQVTRAGGVDGGSLLSETALKEMDSGSLVLTLQGVTHELPEADRSRILDAATDAAWLHKDQLRGNRAGLPRAPYVEHPLRNTVRLARWGVTDTDVLVASLLHDAAEDADQQIAQLRRGPEAAEAMSGQERRTEAISWVKDKYGERVAGIVEAVSNPVSEGEVSRAEQVATYREHVSAAIAADPGAGLVKWADYVDNAGSLHHNELNPKTIARAEKYQEMVPVWREQLQDRDGGLAQLVGAGTVEQFRGQLDKISDRLDTVTEAGQRQAARARTIELNEQAANFFAARLPGSRAERMFTDRLGVESMQGPWRVGNAPAEWTALTDHLKSKGATDEELVMAGLGMVTKRGNVVDIFRDRATVAVRDAKGEVIGFTGRDVSTADMSAERVAEIRQAAAEFYASRLADSSAAQQFHAGQANPAAEQGYAPAGWTELTRHLQGMGVTDEEIVATQLGQISSKGNVIDRLRDRAVEVERDADGNVTGFVGHDLSGAPNAPATVSTIIPRHINSPESPAFHKGAAIFGAYEAQQARDAGQLRAIGRTEGALDAMAIGLSADRQVYGVAPMGTALTARQANAIAALAGEHPVLSALDRDKAGQQAAANDFALLSCRGVAVHDMPMTRMDPAEMRQHDRPILDGVIGLDPQLHPLLGETVIASAIDAHREGAFFTDDRQMEEAGDDVARLVAGASGPDRERLEAFARRELKASGGETAVEIFDDALLAGEGEQVDTVKEAAAEQRAIAEQEDDRRQIERSAEQHQPVGRLDTVELSRPIDRMDTVALPLPYSRAAESELRGLSPDARVAVTASAHGYSQSTGAMLAGGRKADVVWNPKRESNAIEQSASRSKGVRR